jgi:hypothetical protein
MYFTSNHGSADAQVAGYASIGEHAHTGLDTLVVSLNLLSSSDITQ